MAKRNDGVLLVKDLKALLANIPDEALVLLGSDAEGNSFSPLAGYTEDARYLPHRLAWRRGEAVSEGLPEFNPNRGKVAILLWPLH